MRISKQLLLFSRQAAIGAALIIAAAVFWIMLSNDLNRWASLLQVTLITLAASAVLTLMIYYTSGKRIQSDLKNARTVTTIDARTYQTLPIWLWVVLTVMILGCSSIAPYMLIIMSSFLIGSAIALPLTARKVVAQERGGAEYYSRMSPETRQPEILRYFPLDDAPDANLPTLSPTLADELDA